VIFDMDGVLIDSVETALRVKAKLFKQYGVDLDQVPDPHNEQHKGSSLRALLTAVKHHHGIVIDHQEFSEKAVAASYHELQKSNISADPALRVLLQELQGRGIPMAIATSGLRASVENKLRVLGIKDFFAVIITADDVAAHKPDPECYVSAMAHLQANPAQTIIFEDSLAGIQAGLAAGATVVGFTGYNTDKSPLAGTALTVDSWNEVTYEKLEALVT
jgi:HAD superfamily hydrolase (TIGR01509 family)